MLQRYTWFRHASFRWAGDGLSLYIDPWELPGDNPPADVIFITHGHYDHFQKDDIEKLRKDDTAIVATRDVAGQLSGSVTAVGPGQSDEVKGVRFQTVPAYNIVEGRTENHPKASGFVGYLLELEGRTYYHAGDTDHLPELESVRTQVAFLPIGGATFTMDVPEAVGLARAMSPGLAVPMHYGGYVEGTGPPSDGEAFRRDADPVPVEVMTPVDPFPG
ncbi:MAG TPA: MBL fold metallo-hydrolase [Actinomycetota bacterium]|jgi:L-ascorbate metabolism protein UlaG (beta-lactamase superfamily)|nr:MBL fold metallo-hydrolase [Actinomycetota bacterium]